MFNSSVQFIAGLAGGGGTFTSKIIKLTSGGTVTLATSPALALLDGYGSHLFASSLGYIPTSGTCEYLVDLLHRQGNGLQMYRASMTVSPEGAINLRRWSSGMYWRDFGEVTMDDMGRPIW